MERTTRQEDIAGNDFKPMNSTNKPIPTTPKERLLLKLEESVVKITNEESLSYSAHSGLMDLIKIVRHLVEENETLKADVQALKETKADRGHVHSGWAN